MVLKIFRMWCLVGWLLRWNGLWRSSCTLQKHSNMHNRSHWPWPLCRRVWFRESHRSLQMHHQRNTKSSEVTQVAKGNTSYIRSMHTPSIAWENPNTFSILAKRSSGFQRKQLRVSSVWIYLALGFIHSPHQRRLDCYSHCIKRWRVRSETTTKKWPIKKVFFCI